MITPQAAGLTGSPNVDWCETNREATIRTNVLGVLSVVDACWQRGVHVTLFATGCIYEYDALHPVLVSLSFEILKLAL